MRFFTAIGLFVSATLLISSCKKDTNSNPVPVISFKSFTPVSRDSAYLQINFSDGDGDIGYQPQDASAPFNLWIRYSYYDYTTNQFVGLMDTNYKNSNDSVYFTYHIPYITPTGKDKSLTGIIQVAITTWFVPPPIFFSTADSTIVQYKVWLIDRAGHTSNVITTPSYHGI